MSPLYFVLQEFVMTLEGVTHGFCFSLMLTPKRENCPRWLQVLLMWGVFVVVMSINWISGIRVVGYISLVFSFVLVQLMLKAVYREPLKTRIWAWMLLYMLEAVADLAVSFVYIVILGAEHVNHMQDEMIPVLCIVTLVGFVLELCGSLIYRKRRKKGTEGYVVAASAMMVILLYVLMIACGMFFWQGNYTAPFLTCLWVSVGGTAIILMICLGTQRRQKKENRMEWENLVRLRQSQEDFFCRLEKLERETSFIRHDHVNVLGTITQLLEQSQIAEAKEILESYLDRMEDSLAPTALEAEGAERMENLL